MSRNAIIVEEQARTGRKQRRPSHPFNVKYRPWELTPFLIAPVLPGETMKNLLLQARCVSDPIKNPLIGWHNEYYFFYVKLRDLDQRDAITNMIISNNPVVGGPYVDTGRTQNFNDGKGYDYVQACNDVVLRHYFRDDEELTDTATGEVLGTVHRYDPSGPGRDLCKVTTVENFMQSMILDSDAPKYEQEGFPGENLTQETDTAPPGFTDQFNHWKAMRDMQLVAVDFDDWLKTFGVKVPKQEQTDPHIPELIRYVREWGYPANTINPTNGAPSSAMSWSVAERADKDRFFAEPGFVFGLTCARPKVYLGGQRSTVTAHLNDAFSWLPALLQDDPYTSLRKFSSAVGPLDASTWSGEAYWIDLRDLFLHGEQFVDRTPTEVAADTESLNFVRLPRNQLTGEINTEVKLNTKYPHEEDANGLFKDGAFNHFLRCEGRVDLTILSRLIETTP